MPPSLKKINSSCFFKSENILFLHAKLAMQMSAVAEVQVKAEKERLIESRLIAESEKRLYVKVRVYSI